jgi:spore maturation protein CgeB
VSFRYVFLGLSITSSWGNGHATTYRGLTKSLSERGHEVVFLERDVPWYAQNRDLASPPFARTCLYRSLEELFDGYAAVVRDADLVIVGSYVPDGVAVGHWVQEVARGRAAFYDIDTPVTLAKLASGDCEYLAPEQIARYALYLSFTGGPTLERLEKELGSPCARALYCSVDADAYRPMAVEPKWDLGYLGTYSADRQAALQRLLVEPAKASREARFVVAGPQYPSDLAWPINVERVVHLAPAAHRRFYAEQRFTLNVTRGAMARAGWSPSVRLFEAGACGTPIITDRWSGLEEVLVPGKEIIVCDETSDVLRILGKVDESARRRIGDAARKRILAEHTSMHRAEALERYTRELFGRTSKTSRSVLQVNP